MMDQNPHEGEADAVIADDRSLSHLMALAQAGDGDAYRTVLAECQRWLARYFARRIQPAAIDDLVQETMLSLHRKRATYDPSRPFLPWLAAIARYRWVDRLRRAYRNETRALGEDEDIPVDDDEGEAVIARLSIDRMLETLPDGQATAIRLTKIEGLSIAEASTRTGQSESLVKVNVHRGLKRLNGAIESE